jgi:hypothetical protein
VQCAPSEANVTGSLPSTSARMRSTATKCLPAMFEGTQGQHQCGGGWAARSLGLQQAQCSPGGRSVEACSCTQPHAHLCCTPGSPAAGPAPSHAASAPLASPGRARWRCCRCTPLRPWAAAASTPPAPL